MGTWKPCDKEGVSSIREWKPESNLTEMVSEKRIEMGYCVWQFGGDGTLNKSIFSENGDISGGG